jgi:hypothetical protein
MSTLFVERIIERRAAITLQQWWKRQKFLRRLHALTKIKQMIDSIDSPTLYMEDNLYHVLEEITRRIKLEKPKFMEQYINFSFTDKKIRAVFDSSKDKV